MRYRNKKTEEKTNPPDNERGWVSLAEAARAVPYSAEYLGLLARRKILPAKKIRGVWYTTLPVVEGYMREQMERSLGNTGVMPPPLVSLAAETFSKKVFFPAPVSPEPTIGNPLLFASGIVAEVEKEIAEETERSESSAVIPQREARPRTADVDGTNAFLENIVSAIDGSPGEQKPFSEKEAPTEGGLRVVPRDTESDGYTTVLFQNFIARFTTLLDKEIESRESFTTRAWHTVRGAFATVFSRTKLLSLFLIFLLVFVTLPFRVVSGFFDSAYRTVAAAVEDANTVLGFRPGTHANEILLLDQEGKIAIFGNVETEGQFKSFVEDGIAPIYIESLTKVENLNADYLDDLSSEEFTLAFVTKNGNTTYDNVFLEGRVEVGQTLLARGAVKLLRTLEVDGELSVFGDAHLHKGLVVDGPAQFKTVLSAQEIFADTATIAGALLARGNVTVNGQMVVDGFGIFKGGVSADTGTFRNGVSTGGNLSARGDVTLGGVDSDISLTSVLWNIDTEGNATFGGDVTVKDSLSVSATTSVNRLHASTFGIGTTTPGYEVGVKGSALFEGLVVAYEGFVGGTVMATGTLTANGLATFDAGFISSASSTVAGPFHVSDHFSASSTSSFAELAGFDLGFISSASSTVSAPFHATDIIAGSSTLAIDQSAYFALTGGSVGVASSTPWGLLSVEMGTGDPAFVVSNQGSSTPSFYIGGVNQNGFVGVGTSTPQAMFHIANDVTADGAGFGEYDPAVLLSGTTTSVLDAGNDYNWIFGVDISDGGTFKISSSTTLGTNDRFILDGAGIGYFTQGLIMQASSTVSGPFHVSDHFSASSTSSFGDLASFDLGLISNASSSIGGPLYVADTLSASSTLTVASLATFEGGAILGGASSTVSGTLDLNGNVTANKSGIDFGSAGMRFGIVYADEVNATTLVGTLTTGNTSAETFTINSDHTSGGDGEDSFLAFARGGETPTHALLQWDSANDNFVMNFGLITSASSTVSAPFHVSDHFSASSTLTLSGLGIFESGFISGASSTVSGPFHISDHFSASSTLTLSSLGIFESGFISGASSTVSGPFHVSDIIAGSSTIAVDQSAYFALQSGRVGVGTNNPQGVLSVSDATLSLQWAQVGNDLNITAEGVVGSPALTTLSPNRVAFIDAENEDLRVYEFNGLTWAQIGTELNITAEGVVGSPALTTLSPNRVAFIDATNEDLRIYEFDGSTWTAVGTELNISGVNIPSLATLSPNRVAFIDTDNNNLHVYEFNGSTWTEIGTQFNIGAFGTVGVLAITTLSPNRVAFIDTENEDLRVYEFNGSTWVEVGSEFNISASGALGSPALATLSPNRVAFIDGANEDLRVYEFNGSTWAQIGADLNITPSGIVGTPVLATLSPNRVAFIDSTNEDFRTYQFSTPLLYVASDTDFPYLSVSDAGYTTAEALAVRTTVQIGQSATSTVAINSPALIVSGNADFLGSIGIGTTTPWGHLSVIGQGTSPAFVVTDTSNNTDFIVDASGNVGVGTSTPAFLFSVDGSAYISNELFVGNSITATSTLSVGNPSDPLVGLASFYGGFIASASSSVSGPFHVSDHFSASSTSSFGDLASFDLGLISNASSSIGGPLYVADTLSASSTLTVASLATFDSGFISSASSTVSAPFHATDIIAGSSTLAIDQSAFLALLGGSVGVASSTPWGLLSVEKSLTGVPTVVVGDYGSSTPWFVIDEGGNTQIGDTLTVKQFNYLGGTGVYPFAGYVGIGTTTPSETLHVAGTARFDAPWYIRGVIAGASVETSGTLTEDTFPQDLAFKPDGTKVYVIGGTNDRVYQYPLSIPWRISSIGATEANSGSLAADEGNPRGLAFKLDGTKVFIIGEDNNTIRQYPLSTAWDISTIGASEANSGALTTDEANTQALAFKTDGTKVYVIGDSNDTVRQYPLSTAWNIATIEATEANSGSLTADETDPQAISFKTDGTKVYVIGTTNDTIRQYPLSTAWDISTIGATEASSGSLTAEESNPRGIAFEPNGTRLFYVGSDDDTIYQYSVERYGALVVNEGGNVGIGTTTPWGLLSVEMDTTNPAFVVSNQGSSTPAFYIGGVNQNGVVGIGTSSPRRPLHIRADEGLFAMRLEENSGGQYMDVGITAVGSFNIVDSNGNRGFLVQQDAPTNSLFIENTGFVGIGDGNPYANLNILDSRGATTTIGGNTAGDDAILALYEVSTLDNQTGISLEYAGGTNDLNFYDWNSGVKDTDNPFMTIDGSGFIGIGTAAPTGILEVELTSDGAGFIWSIASDETGTLGVLNASAGRDRHYMSMHNTSGSTAVWYGNDGNMRHGSTGSINLAGDADTGTIIGTETSDERLKENIVAIPYGLKEVLQLRPIQFYHKLSKKTEIGFGAQTTLPIVPETVYETQEEIQGVPDVLGMDYARITPVLTRAIQDIASVISITDALHSASGGQATSTPSIYIASDGSVGIGSGFSSTTPPTHALEVAGDVAATGFVNISERNAKKDIALLNSQFLISNFQSNPNSQFSNDASPLEKLLQTPVYTYRYSGDETEEMRLGLIAEEAPPEVLSFDGKGVDIYKLASFTLAGVQELTARVESQDDRITKLEQAISSIVPDTKYQILDTILSIIDGVAHFTDLVVNNLFVQKLVVENVTAHALTVGSAENRAGITIYDKNTGAPFCLEVVDGDTATTAGACGENPQTPIPNDQSNPNDPVSDTASSTLSISVNGANPALIPLGDSYSDNGATVVSEAYPNLGYDIFVTNNSIPNSKFQIPDSGDVDIDTSTSTTYTITYTATDPDGNTAVAERMVTVGIMNDESGTVDENDESASSTPEIVEETASSTPPVAEESPAAEPTEPVTEETATSTETVVEEESATTTEEG